MLRRISLPTPRQLETPLSRTQYLSGLLCVGSFCWPLPRVLSSGSRLRCPASVSVLPDPERLPTCAQPPPAADSAVLGSVFVPPAPAPKFPARACVPSRRGQTSP